jgi:hypothetical protein
VAFARASKSGEPPGSLTAVLANIGNFTA